MIRPAWRGEVVPSPRLFPRRTRISWLAPLLSGALLAMAGIGWALGAPAQFGGQVTYIAVTGNSMEPGLKNGDLAIVRAADHYTVGEIALYRHPQIGPVIHRIIGRQDDEHFSFQGDNNTWVDSYTPGAADLLGALWFQLPHAGAALEWT